MLLPPPEAPPGCRSGLAAGLKPAVNHKPTNARRCREVEWIVRFSATMLDPDLGAHQSCGPPAWMDRLRLRGPNGARDEFLLAATAQNLRKMAKLIPMPATPAPA